jgi:hypothetical protein
MKEPHMQLPKLQEQFEQSVLGTLDDALASKILENHLPVDARFQVYRTNILENFTDALTNTFEACQKLVGEEFFRAMAKTYAKAHPPKLGNLNLYGADFPGFISIFKPAASVPYLSTVAAFEWAWNTAFHAEVDAPLTPEHLQTLSEEAYPAMKLSPRHSVQLLKLPYNALAIWHYCQADGEAKEPDMSEGDHYFLIHRPQLDVEVLLLTQLEYLLLLGAKSGQRFEQLTEYGLTQDKHFNISMFLTKLLQLQLIKKLPHACAICPPR